MTRVLLVEDSPSAREVLAALLEDEGYEVVQAASLAEARSHASSEAFGLAIVDRALPDGDGADLVGELARRDPRPEVVVLSGSPTAVPGARLCLLKGGAPSALIDAISRVVGPRS